MVEKCAECDVNFKTKTVKYIDHDTGEVLTKVVIAESIVILSDESKVHPKCV